MISITYSIPNDKVEEFRAGFLKCNPIPVMLGEEQPSMTAKQWIKEWGKQQFLNAYRVGKQQMAREQMTIEDNLIE